MVEGITRYALENYEEIKEKCTNRNDEYRLKVYAKRANGTFQIKNDRAHLPSYELVRLVSQDKDMWTFEELVHLKLDLYQEVIDNIRTIEYNPEVDMKRYEPPKLNKQLSEASAIYYADVECDTTKYHRAYCISYMKSDEQEPHCTIGMKCLSEFLDHIPDKAIVYFHNLGYDICAFYNFIRTSRGGSGSRS